MNFSQALVLIKEGNKLARKTWNVFCDKDWNADRIQFIYLVNGSVFEVNRPPLNKIFSEGTKVIYRPHIDLRASDGTCGVWSPSNDDVLSEDWEIVE